MECIDPDLSGHVEIDEWIEFLRSTDEQVGTFIHSLTLVLSDTVCALTDTLAVCAVTSAVGVRRMAGLQCDDGRTQAIECRSGAQGDGVGRLQQ